SEQVAVSIAQEAARAAAESHQRAGLFFRFGAFQLADIGLMIGHSHVLGPEFWRHAERHPGRRCNIEHLLSHAFWMHIDFDGAPASSHAVENRFPEIEATFLYAAFAVYAESNATDRRALLQKQTHRIAAIRTVRGFVQSLDRVIRIRAIDPLVAVHPKA